MAPRRTKPLRDLRSPALTYPENPDASGKQWSLPAEVDLKELARKHGFWDPEAVANRLADIYLWWRGDVQSPKEPTGKERREFFSALIERSHAVLGALDKLDGTAKGAIYDTAKLLPHGRGLDLRELKRQLKLLERAAIAARQNVPATKAGRRVNFPLKELLAKLWRLYRDSFGKDARRITRVGDCYGGKFFEFAWDATRIVGIRKGNHALGKAMEGIFARVEENDARRRSSP